MDKEVLKSYAASAWTWIKAHPAVWHAAGWMLAGFVLAKIL